MVWPASAAAIARWSSCSSASPTLPPDAPGRRQETVFSAGARRPPRCHASPRVPGARAATKAGAAWSLHTYYKSPRWQRQPQPALHARPHTEAQQALRRPALGGGSQQFPAYPAGCGTRACARGSRRHANAPATAGSLRRSSAPQAELTASTCSPSCFLSLQKQVLATFYLVVSWARHHRLRLRQR